MVPADVRFLSAKDLFISQSALTGEAMPVEKGDAPVDVASGTRHACATSAISDSWAPRVVSGTAAAVVVATGDRTYFGSMAKEPRRPAGPSPRSTSA